MSQKHYWENFKTSDHKHRFWILKVTVFPVDIGYWLKLLSNLQATLNPKSLEDISNSQGWSLNLVGFKRSLLEFTKNVLGKAIFHHERIYSTFPINQCSGCVQSAQQRRQKYVIFMDAVSLLQILNISSVLQFFNYQNCACNDLKFTHVRRIGETPKIKATASPKY